MLCSCAIHTFDKEVHQKEAIDSSMADNKESENKTMETSETSENKEKGKEEARKEDDSSKSDETSASLETKKTSEIKPKKKLNKVTADRMSFFEKELLECKKRQLEMENKASSMEQKLCRTIETVMRKLEFVLEQRPWLPPANPPPQRWGFYQPLTLLDAAQQGDASELLRLLSTADDCEDQLHQRDKHGDTPLHLAVRGGHLHAMRILLTVGANVSVPGRRLRTPLHCAAGNGHLQIVRRLLDAGATVDAKDADGATALSDAAMFGHEQVVSLLLKNGARPDEEDDKGMSPIFHATSGGHTKVIHLLLEKGVSLNGCYKGDTLLVHAAKASQWSVVKLLMEKGVSPEQINKPEDSPLALAAKDGEGDIVRELLRKGSAANKEEVELALNEAKTASVVWALVEAVPLMVRGEAGKWGLLYAAEAGRLEVLVALLDAGVEIRARDSRGITPLHTAAWNGHFLCVRELLLRGADVQWQDDNGDTPLHKAALADQLFCIQILLEAGAKKDEVNKEGKIASQVATSQAARRTLDEEGFFYSYALSKATKPSESSNKQVGSQSGTLFGTSSQLNNEKNVDSFNHGQSNAQVQTNSFGLSSISQVNTPPDITPPDITPPGNIFGSAAQTFGHVNASQGSVFGSSAQNKTGESSLFNSSVKANASESSSVFGAPGQAIFSGKTSSSFFGAPSQAIFSGPVRCVTGDSPQNGTENKGSSSTFGQKNNGAQPFGNNAETNRVASFGSSSTNARKCVFRKPDESVSKGIGTSANSSHPINSQSGNSMFGMIGSVITTSASTDKINTPMQSFSFGMPTTTTFGTNRKTGVMGTGGHSVNKEEENSVLLNSGPINLLSGYSLFGMGSESVIFKPNIYTSLYSNNTNSLSGYKVSCRVNESIKSNELIGEPKNVKGESVKELNDELPKEVKDTSLQELNDELPKEVKDTSLQELNDELPKEVKDTSLQELNDELPKEVKDTSLQELNDELPKEVKDTSLQELNDELPKDVKSTSLYGLNSVLFNK